MSSSLGASGWGNGGIWGERPFRSHRQRKTRSNKSSSSSSKPSNSPESTGGGGPGHRFPLKQAVTAGSLALTGDTIAQLRDRWVKNKSMEQTSNFDDFFKFSLFESYSLVLQNRTATPFSVSGEMKQGEVYDSQFNTQYGSRLLDQYESGNVSKLNMIVVNLMIHDTNLVINDILLQIKDVFDCKNLLSDYNWLRALRMTSYGFLLYGPGSYAWYQFLDHCMPKQSVPNVLTKVLLNQIVLGPCVIAVVFAWNNLWQGKLAELPDKYQKDALPTLLFGFRFWIPVSVLNFWVVPLQARVAFMSMGSIFWNFCLSSSMSK
ncbi:hypothetical protein LguiA_022377 [Lonicera macranthoides]